MESPRRLAQLDRSNENIQLHVDGDIHTLAGSWNIQPTGEHWIIVENFQLSFNYFLAIESQNNIIHPEDLYIVKDIVSQLHQGRSVVFTVRIITPKLEIQSFSGIGHIAKTAKKSFLTTQSISDKYTTLFNSIDEAVVCCQMITDEEGKAKDCRLLEMNPVFTKMTGFSVAKGQTVLEVLPFLDKWWIETFARAAFQGEVIRFEKKVETLGRWYDAYASPIGNKRDGQFVLVFQDVTERKRRAEHLTFLSEVSKELVDLTNATQTMARLGEKIGRYFGVQWCMFSELSDDLETVDTYGWNDKDAVSLKGHYRMRDFLSDDQLALSNAGQVSIVHNTQWDPRVRTESYGPLGINSFIIVPLARDGHWRYLISIIAKKPRKWRSDEIELLNEITARIWSRLEKVRAEEALRDSEQKLKGLFYSMREGYEISELIRDDDGVVVDYRFLELNRAHEKISGLRIEDVLGRTAKKTYPTFSKFAFEIYDRAVKTGEQQRFEWHIDEVDKWFSVLAYPMGGDKIGVLYDDITERKKAEQSLTESEVRFRKMVEAYAQAVWETEGDGAVIKDSHSWRAYTGQTFEDWITYGWMNAIHPVDREHAEKQWRHALTAKDNFDGDFRIQRASGEFRWTNVRATPILDTDGNVSKWIGMNVDIHQRKDAEELL